MSIFRSASVTEAIIGAHVALEETPQDDGTVWVVREELEVLVDYIDNLEFEVARLKGVAHLVRPAVRPACAALLHEALTRRAD